MLYEVITAQISRQHISFQWYLPRVIAVCHVGQLTHKQVFILDFLYIPAQALYLFNAFPVAFRRRDRLAQGFIQLSYNFV